jgi:uncharacterized protein (TIGR02246 family)
MRTLTFLPLALALFLLPACAAAPRDDRDQVIAVMDRYQAALRALDIEAMAAAFTPSGTLFEPGIRPIQSRESIRAFLASFPGVTVHAATATPETIEVYGDSAYLWGGFYEHLDFPGQPTSRQHGRFVAHFTREPRGPWLIHRLYRIPLPG